MNPPAWNPEAGLPEQTTVLEASAGTGKTHTIAALATRYLAVGRVRAANLAVISFSRAASAELASRIRDRMQHTLGALRDEVDDKDLDETDRLLRQGSAPEVQARITNLETALSDIDQAMFTTINKFSQAMLGELGVLADQDLEASFVEDLTVLRQQVIQDLYLSRFADDELPPIDAAQLQSHIGAALTHPQTELAPTLPDGTLHPVAAFAELARQELTRRKQKLGWFTYDDQLSRLRDALTGPNGEQAAARLRQRCQVVLVDEFQDTDPVQWEILETAFHGQVPLVLIGDPKQSIYTFRDADLFTYSAATQVADDVFSMSTNYRSDPALVSQVQNFFAGCELGNGIGVPPVTAANCTVDPKRTGMRIRTLPASAPLGVQAARDLVVADLTSLVTELLQAGVKAPDIAILVNVNARGRQIARALTTAGVPVALSGAEAVFETGPASHWLVLLRALTEPRTSNLRRALLTDFVGFSYEQLAQSPESELMTWTGTLHGWAKVLADSGVAALFATIGATTGPDGRTFAARLLQRPRGDRDLTDYTHLGELLGAHPVRSGHERQLLNWLDAAIKGETERSDRLRKIETDHEAVQIMTVHRSKGLQFPVVLLPEAWDTPTHADEGKPIRFHQDGKRILDLGGKNSPGRPDRMQLARAEESADQLRKFYVALTRAKQQTIMWWANTKRNTAGSPMQRLLFRDRSGPAEPLPSYRVELHNDLTRLKWLNEAGVVVEEAHPGTPERYEPPASVAPRLELPSFTRQIDREWRRTSYSGLTQGAHDRLLAPPAPVNQVDDEPPPVPAAQDNPPVGPPSPMAELPGGTSFGSLVHLIFEHLDWFTTDPDQLLARLEHAAQDALLRYPLPVEAAKLAAALLPALRTPLGPLADGSALHQIAPVDRLSELDFEIGLGSPRSAPTLNDVATLVHKWLPADDPLHAYPQELSQPGLGDQLLRGFLTGSIDSVFRVGSGASARYVVVDYKTNRLGAEDLRLSHYDAAAMAAEMIRSHYPLQALLYQVALHRFLTQRLSGYRADTHLGGVGYLFVRGMGGPDQGSGTGVFTWRPPSGLVVELSTLLAGGQHGA